LVKFYGKHKENVFLTLRTDKQSSNQTIYVYWTLLYEKENSVSITETVTGHFFSPCPALCPVLPCPALSCQMTHRKLSALSCPEGRAGQGRAPCRAHTLNLIMRRIDNLIKTDVVFMFSIRILFTSFDRVLFMQKSRERYRIKIDSFSIKNLLKWLYDPSNYGPFFILKFRFFYFQRFFQFYL
jgi:hypothetical protein